MDEWIDKLYKPYYQEFHLNILNIVVMAMELLVKHIG